MSSAESSGKMNGVSITVFEKQVPSIAIQAPEGEKRGAEFRLFGGVAAQSRQKGVQLRADSLTGSPDRSRLDAEGRVVASLKDARITGADSCGADFKSNKKMNQAALGALVLTSLALQGQDVQLVDHANDLHISGARQITVKGIEGDRLSIVGSGSPVTADWMKSGLKIQAARITGSVARGEKYRLEDAAASGNVRVVVTEQDGNLTATGDAASFSRQENALTLKGNVKAVSTRKSIPGEMHADKVVVHFKPNSERYEVESIEAFGPGISYRGEVDAGTVESAGVEHIQLWPGDSGTRFEAAGQNAAIWMTPKDAAKTPSWRATSPLLQGTLLKTGELATLEASNRVVLQTGGISQNKKWQMTTNSAELHYSRADSVMRLEGGVAVSGTHPALAGGGATMTAKRAEIDFEPNSLTPKEVRLFGGQR